MLEEIIQFAKQQMGDQVKSEHSLSDDQHNEVFNVAHASVLDTIKGQITSGNISHIMDMFNGKADDNPGAHAVASGAQSSVVQSLMDKFGFDSSKAGGIAAAVIPSILQRFSSPDSGNASDAGDLVKKIGLDQDSSVASIVSQFTGDGGIGNVVKGLFGGN